MVRFDHVRTHYRASLGGSSVKFATLTVGPFRENSYVVVDEAQDLSPVSLALMAEACKTAEGLFFAADNKQSLYSRNYTWSSAHPRLQFRGRTALLSRNYRSTREIDRAAFSVLVAGEDEELVASNSVHEGPLPVLVRDIAADKQAEWIARFIRQMARYLHLKASAAAVLVFEHTWIIPVRDAIANAGGVLLDTVRIPGPAVDALLDELAELEEEE